MNRTVLVFGTTWQRRWLGHAGTWASRGLGAGLFAAAAALAVSGLLDVAHERQRHDEAQLALQSAQAALKPAAPVAKRPPPRLNASQTRRLDDIIQQLNMPWTAVLTGLEKHTRPDVGVTLMEPDAKKATIRIQAEAKSIDSLLGYADGFAQDPGFAGIVLLQHETNEQDPSRPARLGFEVRLRASPALPGKGAL